MNILNIDELHLNRLDSSLQIGESVWSLPPMSSLRSRRILAIVDLDAPHQPYKTLKRQSKWEVSALRWNPHTSHSQVFVAAVSCMEGTVAGECWDMDC